MRQAWAGDERRGDKNERELMRVAFEFVLPPEVAEEDAEGFVVNWFKDEGQSVRKGDLLLEVQFEKTAIELEAPVDGVVTEIATARGETVKPGQLLCRIGEAVDEPAEGMAKPESGAATGGTATGTATPGAAGAGGAPAASAGPAPTPAPAQSAPARAAGEVRSTPAARRVAREYGVDLTLVTGTGPGGRIGEDDVRAYVEARGGTPQRDSMGVVEGPAGAGSSGAPGGAVGPQRDGPSIPSDWKRTALSPAQRTTGERMWQSLQQTAQYTLFRIVDVSPLAAWRNRMAAAGKKVSWTDLFHRSVVVALQEFPLLQAALDGEQLAVPKGVDLNFAVAREDDLFAPVLRNAHEMDLATLRQERERLTEAVLAGRVAAQELQGGTFTVTNLGTLGVDHFTPVLNPPQPAILGLGRLVERAAPDNGAAASVTETTLSLTLDHRIVNGAVGARFLGRLAELFADPEPWLQQDGSL